MNLFEMEKHHTKTLWLLALLLTFSTVVWAQGTPVTAVSYTHLDVYKRQWKPLYEGKAPTGLRVKIHRFDTVWGDAVRMTVLNSNGTTSIAEFGVYCERR